MVSSHIRRFAIFGTLSLGQISAAEHGAATALFLFPWAMFSLYMLIGALRTNLAIVIAFVLVEATLIPLIIGNATGSDSLVRLGGCFGVVLALEVWYIAAAEVLNHQFQRTVLPLKNLAK